MKCTLCGQEFDEALGWGSHNCMAAPTEVFSQVIVDSTTPSVVLGSLVDNCFTDIQSDYQAEMDYLARGSSDNRQEIIGNLFRKLGR